MKNKYHTVRTVPKYNRKIVLFFTLNIFYFVDNGPDTSYKLTRSSPSKIVEIKEQSIS